MHRRPIHALAMAAALVASGPVVFAPPPARTVVKAKKHDPERLAAAQAKRARKNARRLALG